MISLVEKNPMLLSGMGYSEITYRCIGHCNKMPCIGQIIVKPAHEITRYDNNRNIILLL